MTDVRLADNKAHVKTAVENHANVQRIGHRRHKYTLLNHSGVDCVCFTTSGTYYPMGYTESRTITTLHSMCRRATSTNDTRRHSDRRSRQQDGCPERAGPSRCIGARRLASQNVQLLINAGGWRHA
jgi:hypothetical protein